MYFTRVLSLVCVLLLAGCQSTLMEPITESAITNIKEGNSRVIFMRSAFTAKAIQASVFEIINEKPEFIGIISNDTKLAFDTSSGEHMFMVVGESADFLKATLAENKTYYSIVSPRFGFWKARFSLHPVRNTDGAKFKYQSKEFKEIEADTKFVKSGSKANNWANKNLPSIRKKLSEYLPEWQNKGIEKQNQATINIEDHL